MSMARQATATVSRLLTTSNSVEFDYASIQEAFPEVEPCMKPIGTLVLVQMKQPKSISKGGIILPDDPRSTEHYNTQVAKVIALGPLAFKTIYRGQDASGAEIEEVRDWVAGSWYKAGDFVWVGKYGGDRFSRVAEIKRMETNPDNGRKEAVTIREEVIFALYKAKDVHGVITGSPLAIKAYLD